MPGLTLWRLSLNVTIAYTITMNKKFWVGLGVLFCISSLVIFIYPSIPAHIDFDELAFTHLAFSLDGKPYTPYSQLATGHSTLYFYLLLGLLKLFGTSIAVLRSASAVSGVIAVMVFYTLFVAFFSKSKEKHFIYLNPFLGALILATSRWYFNFARFAYEGVFLIMLEGVSILLAVLFVRSKQKGWLIMSGIFAGLAYLSYIPGRFFVVIPLLYLWLHKTSRRAVGIFLVAFVVVILPLCLYLIDHPDKRVNQQLYLVNTELRIEEKGEFLLQNIISIPQMLTVKGDGNGRHNYPFKAAVNPILLSLLIVGLISAGVQRRREDVLMFAWLAISLLPTLLTYPWENPHMHRTITFVIPMAYFCARAVEMIREKYATRIATVGLITLVLLSSAYELRTYFVFQKDVFPQAFEIKEDLETALKGYKPH